MECKEKKSTMVDPENWDVSLDYILKQMNGSPLNVHKLLANHPKLLNAWWNFRNYSVEGGELGRRKGELVILRVASYLKSWYEWSSHVDRSLRCGLTLYEIEKVNKGLNKSDWSEEEYLLLSAVDQLIERKSLTTDLYNKIKVYLSDQQIMDIVAIHGMYIILGCMINIWGLELEKDIAERLPDSVRQETFFA